MDILAVLYAQVAKTDPKNPSMSDRDRIFYSKGHACTALYATLQEMGFYADVEEQFTLDGSIFTSHVSHKVPGVEFSTGSLGHALSVAAGTALAGKRKAETWRVFAILSDGELDEGSNWEAFLFAPHHRLDNLIVIVDYNKMQSFGSIQDVLGLEPLREKFEAFGWRVEECDGHNHEHIERILSDARSYPDGRPMIMIAHTIKGKGVSFMEGQLAWHYKSPSADEYGRAVKELQSR